MLAYLLYGLFFISCLALIATVLLQPGKTDAGALFTSNISSSAFGPRGTQTILSKITIAASVCFFVSALLLAMPAITGNISVLQTTAPDAPATNSNTQSPVIDPQQNLLNGNTNVDSNPANVSNAAVSNTNVSATNAGANANAANNK